jgi:Uma2 family endonuclease
MQTKETARPYPAEKKIYTYDDYIQFPDDGNRYEIIEGELFMSPSPKTRHQRSSRILEYDFISFVEKHQPGEVFDAPFDVLLSKTNIVQPDIIFVSNENKKVITEDNIQGAPDLLVEILSVSTAYNDLVNKKALYEHFAVKEYWIVDPMKEWIEIYILKSGKFELHQRVETSGKITSFLLKGFEITLEDLFRNVA